MTRYSAPQTQRSRHLLNREALKRSHRRGDLIRTLPDVELPAAATPVQLLAEVVVGVIGAGAADEAATAGHRPNSPRVRVAVEDHVDSDVE